MQMVQLSAVQAAVVGAGGIVETEWLYGSGIAVWSLRTHLQAAQAQDGLTCRADTVVRELQVLEYANAGVDIAQQCRRHVATVARFALGPHLGRNVDRWALPTLPQAHSVVVAAVGGGTDSDHLAGFALHSAHRAALAHATWGGGNDGLV